MIAGACTLVPLALGTAPVLAASYNATYQGVVTSVYNPTGLFDSTVAVGTPVNASLLFDYPAPTFPVSSNLAAYYFTGAPDGVTATFGDYTYTPSGKSYSGFLVGNNVPVPFYSPSADFVVSGMANGTLTRAGGPAPSLLFSALTTELADKSGTALATDALPLSYNLANFGTKQLQFGAIGASGLGFFNASLQSVSVQPVSASAVPEPAPALVFLCGIIALGGLVAQRRLRRQA